MRGKIAFVLGAAVGYVLGTRAGRERYEQIKRGAKQVWSTEPVQRGVSLVKDVVDERADDLKVFVARVGADVFSSLAQPKRRPGQAERESASGSDDDAETNGSNGSTSSASTSSSSASGSTKSAAEKASSGSGGTKRSSASGASRKSSTAARTGKTGSAKASGKGGSARPKAGS